MTAPGPALALEPDFALGPLTVRPSACRIVGRGGEVRVEAQTMAVLLVLARADGATVPREALIEACWQGRVVSDDAVARAIAKVRALAGAPAAFTLETIPKVGYRLLTAEPGEAEAAPPPRPSLLPRLPRPWILGALATAAAAAVLAGAAWVSATASPSGVLKPPPATGQGAPDLPGIHAADVADALFTLNDERLRGFLRAGWNPNWHLDSEGNAALHILMEVCERNPSHDRAGVVRIARILLDAGADPALPNKWTDTPLIIARAKRYCGPDHPVVPLLLQRMPAGR